MRIEIKYDNIKDVTFCDGFMSILTIDEDEKDHTYTTHPQTIIGPLKEDENYAPYIRM